MATPTADAPRAPIQMDNSGLLAIMEAAKYLMGNAATTTGGNTNTSTTGKNVTTSDADLAALRQVFAQQSDPNGLMNEVLRMFDAAAQQVPVLTTQYANATGSRVSGNSALRDSLAVLNTDLARSIAQSVVQQQANASTTAGRIADATRSQTQTQEQQQVQQRAPQVVTTKPATNPLLAAGVTTLGGWALNKYGKANPPRTGGAGGNVESGDYGAGTAPTAAAAEPTGIAFPAGATPQNMDFQIDSPVVAPTPSVGVAQPTALNDFVDIGGDLASGFGADLVDEAIDIGGSFVPDLVDEGSSLIGDIFDFIGFADGGAVRHAPRIGSRRAVKGYADGGEIEGYASGGEVLPMDNPKRVPRNFPQFGAPPSIIRTPALNRFNMPVIPEDPRKREAGPVKTGGSGGTGTPGGFDAGNEPSGPGDAGPNGVDPANPGDVEASPAQAIAVANALISQTPLALVNAVVAAVTGKTIAQHVFATVAPSSGAPAPAPAPADEGVPGQSVTPSVSVTSVDPDTGQPVGETDTSTEAPAPAGMPPAIGPDPVAPDTEATPAPAPDTVSVDPASVDAIAEAVAEAVAASVSTDTAPATADPATDAGVAGGTADAGASTAGADAAADAGAAGGAGDAGDGGSAGDGGGDGGGGDGGGWADGGRIRGKRPANRAVDNVTINAQSGEYMLPVDVVDFVGTDFLDNLVALVHTPVNGGTRG